MQHIFAKIWKTANTTLYVGLSESCLFDAFLKLADRRQTSLSSPTTLEDTWTTNFVTNIAVCLEAYKRDMKFEREASSSEKASWIHLEEKLLAKWTFMYAEEHIQFQDQPSGLSGYVAPLLWITTCAAKFPALTASEMSFPATSWDKNPPTKASPAPFVSTSLSFETGITGNLCTCTQTCRALFKTPSYFVLGGERHSRKIVERWGKIFTAASPFVMKFDMHRVQCKIWFQIEHFDQGKVPSISRLFVWSIEAIL